MTIREAQTTVDQWIKQYGVRYFSELTNMAILTEEVGELARVVALCMANQTGVDLTEELRKSIEKKTCRDSQRHINNPKLSTDTSHDKP